MWGYVLIIFITVTDADDAVERYLKLVHQDFKISSRQTEFGPHFPNRANNELSTSQFSSSLSKKLKAQLVDSQNRLSYLFKSASYQHLGGTCKDS